MLQLTSVIHVVGWSHINLYWPHSRARRSELVEEGHTENKGNNLNFEQSYCIFLEIVIQGMKSQICKKFTN